MHALAGERLRDLLRTMNACMCELGSEAKMHDMVEAAMNENWGVIRAHIDGVDQIITGVVADGVALGEFDADPKIAGRFPNLKLSLHRSWMSQDGRT